jgi:uncharacterized membrane protein YesL
MNFLNKVADIMILNLLFIIFSIPLFTMGASFTASYYMGYKMVKGEETYIVKGFWKAFKENFVQSTILWAIILLIAGVLVADYRMILYSGIEFARWMRIAILAVTVVLILGISFVFPMQARYANTVKNTFKNAFLMSLAHIPSAVAICVIFVLPVVVYYFFPQLFAVLFLLSFGLIFMGQSFLLMKIFTKYEEKMFASTDEETPSGEGIFAESDRMEREAKEAKKKK